jgi:peroxiredoxin Q/BCP
MQSFQRDLEKFESLDTQVLAVSTDRIETHRKFAEEYDFSFPLISDEAMEIKGMYGRNRITYLIDKKGIIRFIQRGRPYNEDILKYIGKLPQESKSQE